MSDEMQKLANRANAQADQLGFSHCSVHSEKERILRFECSDNIVAERFQGTQQGLNGLRAWIDGSSLTTVYVQYPS